jgi:hypothetical protein
MDRQRYCRQLTRYRNTLRVSVDPVAAGEEIADLVGRRRHPPPVETDGSAYCAISRPHPLSLGANLIFEPTLSEEILDLAG